MMLYVILCPATSACGGPPNAKLGNASKATTMKPPKLLSHKSSAAFVLLMLSHTRITKLLKPLNHLPPSPEKFPGTSVIFATPFIIGKLSVRPAMNFGPFPGSKLSTLAMFTVPLTVAFLVLRFFMPVISMFIPDVGATKNPPLPVEPIACICGKNDSWRHSNPPGNESDLPSAVVMFTSMKWNPENWPEKFMVRLPRPLLFVDEEDVIDMELLTFLPVSSSLASNMELKRTFFAAFRVRTSNTFAEKLSAPLHRKSPPSPNSPSSSPPPVPKPPPKLPGNAKPST